MGPRLFEDQRCGRLDQAKSRDGRNLTFRIDRKTVIMKFTLKSFYGIAIVILMMASAAFAQEPAATPSSATPDQTLQVPAIAPNYRAVKLR